MASSYALPTPVETTAHESHHDHGGHNHGSAASNGYAIKKTASNGSLFSPNVSSYDSEARRPSQHSVNGFKSIRTQSSASLASMLAAQAKVRDGGSMAAEPAPEKGAAYPSVYIGPVESSSLSRGNELLTFLLYPLPLLVASIGFASSHDATAQHTGGNAKNYAALRKDVLDGGMNTYQPGTDIASGLMEVLTLTSATLLLLGLVNKLQDAAIFESTGGSTRRPSAAKSHKESSSWPSSVVDVGLRCASIALPYFATMTLGGQRSSHILLSAAVLVSSNSQSPSKSESAGEAWSSLSKSKAFLAALAITLILDFFGPVSSSSTVDIIFGYCSLFLTITLLSSKLSSSHDAAGLRTPVSPPSSWRPIASASAAAQSAGGDEANGLLLSGFILFTTTIAVAIVSGQSPPLSLTWLCCSTLAVAFAVLAAKVADPSLLTVSRPLGFVAATALTAVFYFCSTSDTLGKVLWNAAIFILTSVAVILEHLLFSQSRSTHESARHGRLRRTESSHNTTEHSRLTSLLLSYCEQDSLMYSIFSEKDSRRIAYFTW